MRPARLEEAMNWLSDYLVDHVNGVQSVQAKRDGKKAGFSVRTLERAAHKLALILIICSSHNSFSSVLSGGAGIRRLR
jgi:hypothetical protein